MSYIKQQTETKQFQKSSNYEDHIAKLEQMRKKRVDQIMRSEEKKGYGSNSYFSDMRQNQIPSYQKEISQYNRFDNKSYNRYENRYDSNSHSRARNSGYTTQKSSFNTAQTNPNIYNNAQMNQENIYGNIYGTQQLGGQYLLNNQSLMAYPPNYINPQYTAQNDGTGNGVKYSKK
ncbi:hypothetical protein MHBO_001534 [Bonamia ostreae]|uniref:Uncharacterized protein n=1 Tax=Bonamia ostreae TaxID=126728 RepID=A0ABV2AJ93_9EUKA